MRGPTNAASSARTMITTRISISVKPRGSFLMAVIGTKLRAGGSPARPAALTGLGYRRRFNPPMPTKQQRWTRSHPRPRAGRGQSVIVAEDYLLFLESLLAILLV